MHAGGPDMADAIHFGRGSPQGVGADEISVIESLHTSENDHSCLMSGICIKGSLRGVSEPDLPRSLHLTAFDDATWWQAKVSGAASSLMNEADVCDSMAGSLADEAQFPMQSLPVNSHGSGPPRLFNPSVTSHDSAWLSVTHSDVVVESSALRSACDADLYGSMHLSGIGHVCMSQPALSLEDVQLFLDKPPQVPQMPRYLESGEDASDSAGLLLLLNETEQRLATTQS
eukprot:jgi/Ulvmu1/5911/UM026_0033.1